MTFEKKLLKLNNEIVYLHEFIHKQLSIILDYDTIITTHYNSIVIEVKDLNEEIIIILQENSPDVKDFTFTTNYRTIPYSLHNFINIAYSLIEIQDQLYLKYATKEELNTINTIFVHDRNCPICNSKMESLITYISPRKIYSCENKCYSIIKYVNSKGMRSEINIFNKESFLLSRTDSIKIKLIKIKQVEKLINEYKENNKYLIEILSENQKED